MRQLGERMREIGREYVSGFKGNGMGEGFRLGQKFKFDFFSRQKIWGEKLFVDSFGDKNKTFVACYFVTILVTNKNFRVARIHFFLYCKISYIPTIQSLCTIDKTFHTNIYLFPTQFISFQHCCEMSSPVFHL